MNLFGDVGLLAPLAIAVPLAVGMVAVDARRVANRARKHELREAAELLKIHCDAMEALDDEALPESLLHVATRLSFILHEPGIRETVLAAIKLELRDAEPPSVAAMAEAGAVRDDYSRLLATHPHLATAFIQCIVSGILAFEARWPDCAGVFGAGAGLSEVVSAPIEKAQRIVRASGRMDANWRTLPAAPIAA